MRKARTQVRKKKTARIYQFVLPTDPAEIQTWTDLSSVFLTLVNLIKEGNILNDTSVKHACRFLDELSTGCKGRFTKEKMLFNLVKTPDGTCHGFSESLTALLEYRHPEIAHYTFFLIFQILNSCSSLDVIEFVESGFFVHLSRSSFSQETYVSPETQRLMMSIVYFCLDCSQHFSIDNITAVRNIPELTVHQTLFTNIIQPLSLFLNWEFKHAIRNDKPENLEPRTRLLRVIILMTPFSEQTTNYVLTSPMSVMCTTNLDFIENEGQKFEFLNMLMDGIKEWKSSEKDVEIRGRKLMGKLSEEGLFDELEQTLQLAESVFDDDENRFLGGYLLHMSNGNLG
ncbi:hypothetical protein BLNAU_6852 [Blattamonas nauphoetae]|uniref:Uncharacterized protein n=1 Tax=Blattamonas nauphoetae TaxID=2049346 RepID=A0ABQ9Y371_9EUKA|nr:hypothetical protein BLNAU_6852 [Blattamonas nauphoetae]